MKGTVLYGPRDIRFEERKAPTIQTPTDAIIRISATCVCGSDLWPYRGAQPTKGPAPMGHEYCGIVEEVSTAVNSVRPGQFVIGSFFASGNTCPHCHHGYRLVRCRRGMCAAGLDGRGRRRRRGRPSRRALGQADGRRANHRDESTRGAAEARPARCST